MCGKGLFGLREIGPDMKQQTKLSLITEGLRVMLLILMAAFSFYLLMQSNYYMDESTMTGATSGNGMNG